MAGLISSLHNSSAALRVHSKGLEVTGKNLANVNNRGYSKERVEIGDRGQINTGVATESMGVEAMGLRQNRDALLDKSVMREITSASSLEAAKKVLESAEIALGQFLDRTKDSTSIQNASGANGGGISDALTDFFNAWESFSVKPNDVGEKQLLIAKAQILAEKINSTDKRLAQVQSDADAQIQTDVAIVNGLLAEIAKTNEYIAKAELVKPFSAVDLRDQRQAKLEELAQYIDVTFDPIVPDGMGQISVKSGNVELINGKNVFGAFKYDADPAKRQFGFDFTENNKTFQLNSGLIVGKLNLPKDSNGKDIIFDGYPSSPLPVVTVSGNNGSGSGAVVEPIVQNGKITSFSVKNAGQGYTTPLTISISAPVDVQYSSASPIASGKLRAQQEASTGNVQTARDQIKDLAIQLKQELNNTYNANGGTGDLFTFSTNSTGLLNLQFTSDSPTAGTAGGNTRALKVAELGTKIYEPVTKSEFTSQVAHNLNDGGSVSVTKNGTTTNYVVEKLSDTTFMLKSTATPPAYANLTGPLSVTKGGTSIQVDGRKLDFSGSFASNFNKTVTILAQELNTTNIRLEDQKLSQEMAVNSRDQYSGVSQDEEITDMMKFQRSFQASARHINVIDTLLEQVVNRLGVG
jgi:flagellar hook-associated protein 1 FlgK